MPSRSPQEILCLFAQFNAAKNFVVERSTLDLKNSGAKPVSEVVVCHPSDLTSSRAFFEVSRLFTSSKAQILVSKFQSTDGSDRNAQVVQGTSEDAPELEVGAGISPSDCSDLCPSEKQSSCARFQDLIMCLVHLQIKDTLVPGAPANVTCEAVTLVTPIPPGKTTTVETYSVLMNQLTPKPKEIEQADVQRVLFTATRYVVSPYKIATASTQVGRTPKDAPRDHLIG